MSGSNKAVGITICVMALGFLLVIYFSMFSPREVVSVSYRGYISEKFSRVYTEPFMRDRYGVYVTGKKILIVESRDRRKNTQTRKAEETGIWAFEDKDLYDYCDVEDEVHIMLKNGRIEAFFNDTKGSSVFYHINKRRK